MKRRTYSRVLTATLGIALVAALALPAGGAAAAGKILPPHSSAFGKTYGAWSAAWWQYVLAQPASSNPLNDSTGAGCAKAQSGPVFFLVGTSSTGTATRDQCTVPAGKALFFPLVNAFDVHTPGDGLDTPELVWNDLQNTIGFGPFSELQAKIDGVPVGNLDPASTPFRACAGPDARCTAPDFSLAVPDENILTIPAGIYAPAVADGFYLLLTPLRPGRHTITFGGKGLFGGSSFSQDITYNLTVTPK
jgi:hypothetical protein